MTQSRAELAERVAPEFRGEFLEFIKTGQASPEFLDYLDRDAACQDAVELAFAGQTEVIREAIEFIRQQMTKAAQDRLVLGASETHGAAQMLPLRLRPPKWRGAPRTRIEEN
jgi:hypothetical protein